MKRTLVAYRINSSHACFLSPQYMYPDCIQPICPPGVGIWFRSADSHKGCRSASGCLWYMVSDHSEKSFGFRISDTWPTFLSGRLPAAVQFPFLLEQDGSYILVTWYARIPGRITIEPPVPPSDLKRPRQRSYTSCLHEGQWCWCIIG